MRGEPCIGTISETKFWTQTYVSSAERLNLQPSFRILQGVVDTVLAVKQSTVQPWMNPFSMGVITALKVSKYYRRVAEIFGFREVDTLTSKDTFMWKRYYKKGLERDYDKEIFFKFINLHEYAELTKSKKYGNQPTFSTLVNNICGAIINTVTFFKNGKLAYALSRQSITGELLKSRLSPWIQARLLLYDAIDNF